MKVTWFENNKEKMIYNVAEEVRAMAIEENRLYTIKDQDCVINEKSDKSDNLVNKAVIPGRYPLALCGPKNGPRRKYLVFCTRDGKGLVLVNNEQPASYKKIWSRDVRAVAEAVIAGPTNW